MIPQELLTGPAPVRKRMLLLGLLQKAGLGSLAGLGTAAVLLLVARAVPILHSSWWAAGCAAAGLIGGLLWGLVRTPDLKAAARAVDRYGLEERVSTALHFAEQGADSPVVRLQRQEAVERLLRVRDEVPKIVPVTVEKRRVTAGFLFLAMMAVLIVWPNPMHDVALERRGV